MNFDEVVPRIRELDEREAVQLASALIYAEADRLQLPFAEFNMSERTKVPDGGVDGKTEFPKELGSLLPRGKCVWQVKSGKQKPKASAEFNQEKHRHLVDLIKNGYDYVLFWTMDETHRSSSEVETEFREVARSIRADVHVTVLLADSAAKICHSHLGVMVNALNVPMGGLFSFGKWGAKQDFGVPYQPDEPRTSIIAAIQEHVRSNDPNSSTLILFGDTGVGKSRLVHEALQSAGIGERVLVAMHADDIDRSLLTMVIESTTSRLILFVDDCDHSHRLYLRERADLAQGRIRLILAGSRYTREQRPDSAYLELNPLQVAASRAIAISQGLSPEEAEQIAEYTEGYPKLAEVLSKSMKRSRSETSIAERIRNEEVGSVLGRMLDDEGDIQALGALALFERLGFDGDLREEARIVCECFNLDYIDFYTRIEREKNRFVSEAGRYRRVTPRLFAIWLATKYIREKRGFTNALGSLPPATRERVIEQMKLFADDGHVTATLREILSQQPFSSGVLTEINEGAARLLHVASIVDPELGISAVESVLGHWNTESLFSDLTKGRRGSVEALEVLVWFDQTFSRAATCILRLALAENERWANNATGVLKRLFGIYLGGTNVSFHQRIAWAKAQLSVDASTVALLVDSVAQAFEIHESRDSVAFGSREQPEEWRPANVVEEIEARQAAWDMLLGLANEPTWKDLVGDSISGKLRLLARRGMLNKILTDIVEVNWISKHRVQMNECLGNILKFDSVSDDARRRIELTRDFLVGDSVTSRASFLMYVQPWLLDENRTENNYNKLLNEIAEFVGQNPATSVAQILPLTADAVNEMAGQILFERAAILSRNQNLLSTLMSIAPLPERPLIGTIRGLAIEKDEPWTIGVLQSLLQAKAGNLVVKACHALPPTPALAALATEAVRSDVADRREVGAFLYGAWAKDLPENSVANLVEVLTSQSKDSDPWAVEHALGIISQWLEARSPESSWDTLQAQALKLLDVATDLQDSDSSMIGLYRQLVLSRVQMPAANKMRMLSRVIEYGGELRDYDLELLDQLTEADPEMVLRSIISLIMDDDDSNYYRSGGRWVQNEKILSRLSAKVDERVLFESISQIPSDRWRELVEHIDFSQDGPTGLLTYLLENSDDRTVASRATFHFIYPEMSWWGPESIYLSARRDVLEQWRERANNKAIIDWLESVEKEIERKIQVAELQEAEE